MFFHIGLALIAAAHTSAALLLPRKLASQYSAKYTSLGCYTDSVKQTLTGREIVNALNNTAEFCTNACGLIGFAYAGTEYGTQCFCGNSIENGGASTADSNCGYQCSGNSTENCGGYYYMNLYHVSNPRASNNNTAFPLDCENEPLKSEAICNKVNSHEARAASLVSMMTLEEKVYNLVDSATGSLRLGLLPYEWWNEALHGVAGVEAGSPGTLFSPDFGAPFSYATSFPEIINLGATFDDALVSSVAQTIGKEARAFANNGHAGFDFWTPNINAYRDPRWGRGLETPGEDPLHIQSYVMQLIPGLQQHAVGSDEAQIIATCKHFAVYDIEQNRYSNNLDPTQQDLGDYYLPPFTACVRDAGGISVMCAYNAVDGVPACANQYLLEGLLRSDYLNFTYPYNYVTSDCDAVANIYDSHDFVSNAADASAVAMLAGTDLDCGTTYEALAAAVNNGTTTEARVDLALTRLYTALFTIGAFDGTSKYNSLGWEDVDTKNARSLAYQAAVESLTLLKNDGTLPLKGSYKQIALIGPMAAATYQMQGNYYGTAPFLHSPLSAFRAKYKVRYAQGTDVNTNSTSGFQAALTAAKAADVIIYIGGIDTSIESEGMDRTTITWPGNQLQLIGELGQLGKPLVVVQWGGGQIDDTQLLANKSVNALVWSGYPGQDGGTAIRDVLSGVESVAGRLPVTQYPAEYVDQVSIYNMNLRPNGSFPGRTYRWYNEKPVLPFGYGLTYTNFSLAWAKKPAASYNIQSLISGTTGGAAADTLPFTTVTVKAKNTGGPANMASDYTGLLYLSTTNAGPKPYPNKYLVSYDRAHDVPVGSSATLTFGIKLGAVARADVNGNLVLYPGTYTLLLAEGDDVVLSTTVKLTGKQATVLALPQPSATYSYPVPVQTQAATT